MKENSFCPLVSVVITTKNEEGYLENCLNSIRVTNYPQSKIETIVVDNNSWDKTKEIAERFTDKVFNQGPERSAQRNLGIEKASGKYILYLDADMSLSREVINQCVVKCEKEGCVALYIPEKITGKGFLIRVRNFERSFYDATCIDAVRFVKKDMALQIGGFDENLTGPEDWDFDRRIKKVGTIGVIESYVSHNEGNFNILKYFKKKRYYAGSFNRYIKKWGNKDITIIKQLGFRYRFIGVFIENNKWKRLLKHPFLALGMYLLKIVTGISYLLLGKTQNSN